MPTSTIHLWCKLKIKCGLFWLTLKLLLLRNWAILLLWIIIWNLLLIIISLELRLGRRWTILLLLLVIAIPTLIHRLPMLRHGIFHIIKILLLLSKLALGRWAFRFRFLGRFWFAGFGWFLWILGELAQHQQRHKLIEGIAAFITAFTVWCVIPWICCTKFDIQIFHTI